MNATLPTALLARLCLRPAVARDLTTVELIQADLGFTDAAAMLGKAGQVSRTQRAVRDELDLRHAR